MAAAQVVIFVQLGEVGGGVLGGVVGLQVGVIEGEGAADYLLDGAGVQVDARTEACHFANVVSRASV